MFLPDITHIGSSAQCDRVFAVRSGFPSDSDGIIHRYRIIFIAGHCPATDGNRVTAVRLRSTARRFVVTADGNRTESFGTCIITEGEGVHRRRFRRVPKAQGIFSRGFGAPADGDGLMPPRLGITPDGDRRVHFCDIADNVGEFRCRVK